MKRKLMIVPLLLAFLLLFTACTPIEEDGIAAYDQGTCSVGLTANLFPSEDFLENYPYQSSAYHYLDTEDWIWGYAKVFACLSYSAEAYADAKAYCMENFNLSDGFHYNQNGYCFAEHICYKSKDSSGEWHLESQFPQHFNVFGYHDESCTLFFLGYYNGDPKAEERTLAQNDFGAFLEEVYAEYYDFHG